MSTFYPVFVVSMARPRAKKSMGSTNLKAIFLHGGLVAKSCPTLATPWNVARQAPLSMEFSRQEYWSGLPSPSPGDLPDPGIEPVSPASQADSSPLCRLGISCVVS